MIELVRKVCKRRLQIKRKLYGGIYEGICSDCIAVAIASIDLIVIAIDNPKEKY